MDPLLRANVWKFLKDAVNASILLTTHYIHEAHSADHVGFMRNGRILISGPPGKILHHFEGRFEALDEVFVHICRQKCLDKDFELEIAGDDGVECSIGEVVEKSRKSISPGILKALFYEEFIHFKREPM
jgi:ABC-type multidrug transport system ATPase subunit